MLLLRTRAKLWWRCVLSLCKVSSFLTSRWGNCPRMPSHRVFLQLLDTTFSAVRNFNYTLFWIQLTLSAQFLWSRNNCFLWISFSTTYNLWRIYGVRITSHTDTHIELFLKSWVSVKFRIKAVPLLYQLQDERSLLKSEIYSRTVWTYYMLAEIQV